MENPFWPLFDLRIRTRHVEIRLPSDDDLTELARLALKGIHDPAFMPFLHPWTDEHSPELERGLLQWGWRHRAAWSPNDWSFNGAVLVDGEFAGVQSLMAKDFATLRSVKTASWLGTAHQGQGIGKEMRSAVLHFAFEGLDAVEAHSGGFIDNESSLAVSRALGYEEIGRRTVLRRGLPTELIDVRLDRSKWRQAEHPQVDVIGLEECRDFFVASATE